MLDELRIENVALIKTAQLELGDGLTVITGETGSGKTALLRSIKLAIGERAEKTDVREGAQELEIQARLYLDGEEQVVRRRMGADGRGRAELNGRMVSVRELGEVLGASVDLCGQHEHQHLLDQNKHTELLDAWIGQDAERAHAVWREARHNYDEACAELRRMQELTQRSHEALDQAQFVLRSIDEVNPQEGEYEELEAQLPKVAHGEALAHAAGEACATLRDDEGVLDQLADALRSLELGVRYDEELTTYVDRLNSALIDLEDIASDLRAYEESVDFDEEELERVQARLAAFEGLKRRFGPGMADVLRKRDEARELVEASQNSDGLIAELQAHVSQADAKLHAAAQALNTLHAQHAPELARHISAQMTRLEMGSAEVQFEAQLAAGSQLEDQRSIVTWQLMYKPGADMAARPLRRIASGGEISRVMLAIKVVLGEKDSCDTLVFDEVDAGVGGATAVALAAVLKDLATTHQVVVVSHLAQVAIQATTHYVVRKRGQEVPETILTRVEGEDRVAEIARMLDGKTDAMSLEHARHLLGEAHS